MRTAPLILNRIMDDEQVKALLVRHGRAAAIENARGLPSPAHLNVVWIIDGVCYIVTYYFGYAKPEDNGYKAIFFNIEGMENPEIEKVINALLEAEQTGPAFLSRYEPCEPSVN